MSFFYFSKPVRELRRRILYERSTWLCSSLASYASLLFWRPPVSGLIEMFLQRRAAAALCELAIESALENKCEHCQEACSSLPDQWARRRWSEKSITQDQLLLTVEDILKKEKNKKVIRLLLSTLYRFSFASSFTFHTTKPIFTLISVHCARVANFQGKKINTPML